MAEANRTTDHETIKKWVEERNGKPAVVSGTENNEDPAGLLRILFSEESAEDLKTISWDDFFDTFEDKDLAFLYQDKTEDGQESRFFKFVER